MNDKLPQLNRSRRTPHSRSSSVDAERFSHMNDDQFAQKGRTAIDPVGITTLSREIFHFQRAKAGITDCGVAACYDRIIP
eukprot:2475233-Ditylum_brightwellii.AAC.1